MFFSLRKIIYQSVTLFFVAALLVAGFNLPPAKAQSATPLSGWFIILWGDAADGLTSFQEYRLQTDNGRSIRLTMDENMAEPWGGVLALNRKRVIVQGAWELNATAPVFQVTSLSPEQKDLTAKSDMTAAAVTGAQPWISIMCYFNGESAPAAPYNSSAYFQNMYGSSYPGLDHYWRELSYNTINVSGSGAASAWVQLPKPFAQYLTGASNFNSDLLFTDCTAAADSIVNYSGYAGINMMFNRNSLVSSGSGYALGGGHSATLDGVTKIWLTTWQPQWGYGNMAIMSHEMGHGFGLPHSSGNYGLTYDNQWDIMSDTWTNCANSKHATYGCLGQHTNSYYKDMLGWIPSIQKFTAAYAGGTTTITLERLAQPASSSNYLMVKIPIGGSSTHFYVVEARKKVGYDVQLPGEAVIIHEVDTARSSSPAQVIDPDGNGNTGDGGAMWTVGEIYTDSPNGISVAVLSSTATGFQVSITTPAYILTYCATSATPNPYISRIQLNGGNQASGAGAGGYEDRTDTIFTTLTKGSSYPVQVTGVWPYGNAQLHSAKIWVDFNKNGDFRDSGEELNLGSVSMTGTRIFSGNLPIPSGALTGTTRMRVMFKYTENGFSAPSPCDTGAWGEAEDYTVTIANATPEMNIKGNNTSIADGDTTPSSSDHTDFGSTPVTGGSVDRIFAIENTGTDNLTLSGLPIISISGPNAADFSITANPTSPVAGSGTTTFTVHFDPSAESTSMASISVANNDSDENPYNFDITGTGTTSLPGVLNKSTPLNAAANVSTSLILSWTASTGATSYEYCYDTTNDNTCSTWVDNGTSTGKVLNGLSQNTTYYWHIRANNVTGTTFSNDLATAFWSFTTSAIPSGGGDTTGVFRPSNGLLYLKNQNTSGFADVAINYGTGGDYPIAGDWDGNGTATIGIYRNGTFYLRNSNTLGYADLVFAFGAPGDQPVAGDWNGDGIDTIGVYSNGQFLLRNSNTAGAVDMSFYLGNPGDVGIAGDWNGDGSDTTGVFRPSNGVIFLKNLNTSGFADININYGLSGDMPVTGDWDNDGTDTIGVYRNAQFLLRNSNTIGFADMAFYLGIPGDMPISGNWDGMP